MPASSKAPGKEQRRSRRYSINFPCEVKPAQKSGERISTQTQDVSCEGLYFSMSAKWEVGTPVEFMLYLPLKATGGRPVALRCEGKVARIVEQEDHRFGIGATIEKYEFTHLDSSGSKAEKVKTALVRSARALRWRGLPFTLF